MFCSKCGKELKEGAKFCTGCGEKANISSEQLVEAPKKRIYIKKRIVSIVLGIIMLAAIVIVASIHGSEYAVSAKMKHEHFGASPWSESCHMLTKYDENGNRVKEIYYNRDGSINEKSEKEYDENGNMTKLTQYCGNGNSMYVGEEEYGYVYEYQGKYEYKYDTHGNLVKEIFYDNYGDVSYEEEQEYEYDAYGNMIQSTRYNNGEMTSRCRYEYKYDTEGNIIKTTQCITDEDGNILLEEDDDEKGNVVKIIYYNSDGSVDYSPEYKYEYDGNGNIISEYSNWGNLTEIEYDINGREIKNIYYDKDGSTCVQEREYDVTGNEIRYISKGYDANGNINYIEQCEHEYDINGNIIKCMKYTNGNINYEREYDEKGNDIKYIKYNDDGSINYEETYFEEKYESDADKKIKRVRLVYDD